MIWEDQKPWTGPLIPHIILQFGCKNLLIYTGALAKDDGKELIQENRCSDIQYIRKLVIYTVWSELDYLRHYTFRVTLVRKNPSLILFFNKA